MIIEHSKKLAEGEIFTVKIQDQVLGDKIRMASSWLSRLRGLLGTSQLAEGCGLWLAPCNSIHMIGMLYRIDVVFLDGSDCVSRVVNNAKLFGLYLGGKGAVSALELPAQWLKKCDINVGDKVLIFKEL